MSSTLIRYYTELVSSYNNILSRMETTIFLRNKEGISMASWIHMSYTVCVVGIVIEGGVGQRIVSLDK